MGLKGLRRFQEVACFTAGTPVQLADGSYTPIENLRVGHMVQARDQHDPQASILAAQVIATQSKLVQSYRRFHFRSMQHGRHSQGQAHRNGAGVDGHDDDEPPSSAARPLVSLEVTSEHPFWSLDANGWVSAEDLSVGAVVRGLDEDWEVTAHEVVAEPTVVYNLTVEGAHTYFVGDAAAPDACAIWVHNTCELYPRFEQLGGLDPDFAAKVRAVNGLSATDEILPSHRLEAFTAWSDSKKFVIDIPESEIRKVFTNGGNLLAYIRHLTGPVRMARSTRGGAIKLIDAPQGDQLLLLKQYVRANKDDIRRLTPDQTAAHRATFDSRRNALIAEWESKTGQTWPRYTQQDLDRMVAEGKGLHKKGAKKGQPIKSIGDPYDAHHIIENSLNGPHEWWNMWPAMFPFEHQGGIHSAGSALNRIILGVDQ